MEKYVPYHWAPFVYGVRKAYDNRQLIRNYLGSRFSNLRRLIDPSGYVPYSPYTPRLPIRANPKKRKRYDDPNKRKPKRPTKNDEKPPPPPHWPDKPTRTETEVSIHSNVASCGNGKRIVFIS